MTAAASWYAVHGPNGDLSWRVTGPAAAIGAKVRLIPEDEGGDIYWPNTGAVFPWSLEIVDEDGRAETVRNRDRWEQLAQERRRLASRKAVYPDHEGSAAVFTRPLAWLAAHMLELRREHGVRVCSEVDDNYLSPSRLNVMFQTAETTDDDRDNHARSICTGDAIIVSTAHLRDAYHRQLREYFPGLPVPEIHVCRNHVDERHMPAPVPREGPLRVGFMGSDSHVWDVDLAYPALTAAKAEGCEIVMVGIDPARINPRYRRTNWDWSSLGYRHIPWKLDYRGTALPLDVGLAPLLVNEHTLCKSDIKALEYALSGAACVAQNCLVFNRTLEHGEHVLLAGSPQEFAAQTVALIRDARLRDRLATNTMTYIREERLLRDNVTEWEQAVFG